MSVRAIRITAALIFGIMLVFECVLLIFNGRVLVSETKIESGQLYPEDFPVEHKASNDLSHNGQAILLCRYFNGRKMLASVYWYSANNIMGRDSCRFLTFED